jgi:hypothetical protein
MEINLYQIIIVGISSIMLFTGIKDFLKREAGQTFLKLFVRIVVWGGMALIAIYPKITIIMAQLFGIVDNMNAVMITGFIFVFLLIFKLLSAIEKIEQNISELTRKEALREAEKQISEVKNEQNC